MLTAEELRIIFEALHGHGYSADERVSRLEVKLCLMLEAAARREAASSD